MAKANREMDNVYHITLNLFGTGFEKGLEVLIYTVIPVLTGHNFCGF